jgi:hypothetical protein
MKHINEFAYKEIFDIDQYQKFVKVDINDFVLDLGCSQGPFFFKIRHKSPEYIGVDASIGCIRDFYENLEEIGQKKITVLNAFIDDKPCVKPFQWFPKDGEKLVNSITFPCLMEMINRNVDFLKFDIEGYEKLILVDNYELFVRKVKKFSGELHFGSYSYMKAEEGWAVLEKMKQDTRIDYSLYSVDGVDISERFWNNKDYYREIIIGGMIKNL